MSLPNRPWFKKRESKINPKLVQAAVNFSHEPKHGYFGFKLYFPEDKDEQVETFLKYTRKFEDFIRRNSTMFNFRDIEDQRCFAVDYKSVTADLVNEWPNWSTQIVDNTEFCLNCMGLAMHQSIMKEFVSSTQDTAPQKYLGIIRARLVNFEPVQQIKDIRVANYGKLVALRGTVIKASNLKVMYKYMAFSCNVCTGVQLVKFEDNAFAMPKKCLTSDCKNQSSFRPLYKSPYTRVINFQHIKIQELIGDNEFESGRIPRSLECEFTEDLVNSCVPGDDITITGIVKERNNVELAVKGKKGNTFLLYLDVVSVVNRKNQSEGSYGAWERITFNMTDYKAIQKIHKEPNILRFLVQSLCPKIYGHEVVKAGLLLALFGSAKSEKGEKRAESHVLVIGDPGLGKSQMLHACVNLAPRGVYVCGNTSTGSGLTVTVTKEGRGECTLEAGALMLADQGVCCIDEFDKMPTQHASLLEAMEQQTISLAKAGIVASLPTRATILAAANPVGGHYNKARTVAENLKISPAMLSRFDLIFILVDRPNAEFDMRLSEHLLGFHSARGGAGGSIQQNLSHLNATANESLRGRLSVQAGDLVDPLPHHLFRKYIAYAQKYVNPELSEEAEKVIKEFYFRLRKKYQNGDCTPITSRQLNSLIRITQARAKIELREEATKQDALDAVEIMKESLMDIFTDDLGALDKTRSQQGSGMSTKNQVMKLLGLMQNSSEARGESVFTVNEIRDLCAEAGIGKNKVYSLLESLNIQGFILNKSGSKYQLVTADL